MAHRLALACAFVVGTRLVGGKARAQTVEVALLVGYGFGGSLESASLRGTFPFGGGRCIFGYSGWGTLQGDVTGGLAFVL
jgi:hypothetical protein